MLKCLVLPILLAMTACVTDQTKPMPNGSPAPEPVPSAPSPDRCATVSETIQLQYHEANGARGTYAQQMPVIGPVAHESHYLIAGLDPSAVRATNDRIIPHLARTCGLLRGAWAKWYPGLNVGCPEVYKGGGATEWTPAEPTVGRGSGALFPSVECEAAEGNMYFAAHAAPTPGTRFIATNPANGKSFVLCMGLEAGPGSRSKVGGVSTEALWYLGGQHGTVLKLGRAVNQALPYGPLECGK